MTRSSRPARDRSTKTPPRLRNAPTYKRLTDERYADLTEDEKARHDAHLDVDFLFDALPYAQTDRDCYGIAGGGTEQTISSIGDHSDPTWNWSLKAEPAIGWLLEQKEARAQLTRIARLARYYWGRDPERDRDGKRTTPTTEICVWCGEPAPDGRDASGRSLIRRVDKAPLHGQTCFYQAYRQVTPTRSMSAVVRARILELNQ